jgi:hypothetical protein
MQVSNMFTEYFKLVPPELMLRELKTHLAIEMSLNNV